MSIAALKRIAAMTEVTKSYFTGLDDAAAEAFLKKSVEEQDKEASDAAAAAAAVAKAAELEKSGKTAKEAELEKALQAQGNQLAELQKKIEEDAQAREIEKTARSADFAGYPGGEAALVPLLKTASKIEDEAARTAYIDSLKAQAASAKRLGTTFGARTEEEIAKTSPAIAQIQKGATALLDKDPELNVGVAMARVMKAQPQLLLDGLAEEERLFAGA